MLRSLTARQFVEWQAYAALDPFGEAGRDRRFALLAGVVAGSAGATTKDGRPYTAETFLAALHGEDTPQKKTIPQTAAQMEAVLMNWIDTSNTAHRERGGR